MYKFTIKTRNHFITIYCSSQIIVAEINLFFYVFVLSVVVVKDTGVQSGVNKRNSQTDMWNIVFICRYMAHSFLTSPPPFPNRMN